MSLEKSVKKKKNLKKLFIISPIGQPGSETRKYFDKVRRHIIDPVASEKGYKTSRADNISRPGRITKQIIERLLKDDLVVADLTNKNPNVFYELAVRHAVHKPVILMGAIDDDIPFDVAAQRVIFYDLDPDNITRGKKELARQISSVESDKFIVDSPIESSVPLEQSKTGNTKQERIDAILRNQSRQLRRIEEILTEQYSPTDLSTKQRGARLPDPDLEIQFLLELEGFSMDKSYVLEKRSFSSALAEVGKGTRTFSIEDFKKGLGSLKKPMKMFYDRSSLTLWYIKGKRFIAWTRSRY